MVKLSGDKAAARIIEDLIAKYNLAAEEIAVHLKASLSSVKNWQHGRTKPQRVYRDKLTDLYSAVRKEKGSGREG